MHRNKLRATLADYASRFPDEESARFVDFVERQPRCFERDCFDDGHVTGSALVLNLGRDAALMTHHAKLGRWLQLGGHCDGDPDALAVACREAAEESGLAVTPLSAVPLDIDIHTIPARGSEPPHFHYDVRFLLQVRDSEEFVATAESLSLAWVPLDKMTTYTNEESVLRLVRKFQKM
ncbi:MAG: NUDIX hydrolase [Gammaproteobacteria bacterium]|nr:NUDIX hydrolase [Gammaproteobacteria bacterium]